MVNNYRKEYAKGSICTYPPQIRCSRPNRSIEQTLRNPRIPHERHHRTPNRAEMERKKKTRRGPNQLTSRTDDAQIRPNAGQMRDHRRNRASSASLSSSSLHPHGVVAEMVLGERKGGARWEEKRLPFGILVGERKGGSFL